MKYQNYWKKWIKGCLLIVLMIGPIAGAQTIPPDSPGYSFRQLGYTIRLTGNTVGAQRPTLEELLEITGPDCAHAEVVDAWDCQNPMRNGTISLAYGYTLQIYGDPGCEGELCISQVAYPKSADICYDFNNDFNIEALILDICDNIIRERDILRPYLVDLDEYIKFYAKITTDDPNIEFPPVIEGRVYACGHEYSNVFLEKKYEDEDSTIYKSTNVITPRHFAEFCNGGALTFEIRWGRIARHTIYINEVRFRIKDVIFADDLPIYSGSSDPVVCYPFGEFLTFGTEVDVRLEDWPDASCMTLPATVIGYSQGIQPVVMEGTLAGYDFTTSQTQTSYHIDDPFREEILDFNFKVSVLDGPERNTISGVDQITVYHGYIAAPPDYAGLSPDNEVIVFNNVSMLAKPYPFLVENNRILYRWIGEGIGEHHGNGSFQYVNPVIGKLNSFTPTYPGDFKIHYKIIDQETGFEVELPEEYHKTIHIRPKLDVNLPVEGHKFVYNTDPDYPQAGFDFEADAVPEELNDYIEWSFSEMSEEVIVFWSVGEPPIGKVGACSLTYMPISHSDFGEKTITAMLPDYDTTVSRNVYLFFDKKAVNAPPVGLPNWYKYWRQPGGPVPGMDHPRISYDASGGEFSGYYNEVYDWMCLASDAADKHSAYTIDDFEFNFEEVRGIDLTSRVVEHEAYHREIYNNWRGLDPYTPHLEEPGIWYTPGREHPFFRGDPNHPDDFDGDGLPNTLEESLSNQYGFFQLDPYEADTYKLHERPDASPIYERIGDQELMARFFSEGARGIEELDWSAGEYSKQWP
ncbi:MAG: hypothetical protein JSW64_07055 [Candidatus Zixiibacteriota bacterium]|nr:MAG: hypothetical protein JSW64_07055 [candidate division Zixibacteria bacterium]